LSTEKKSKKSTKAAPKQTLLVVEDDEGLQSQLRWSFDDYDVVIAGDRESAIAALRRFEPAVMTLDLGLPPDPANASEGLATLEQVLSIAPDTKVIVVTGNDDRENAIRSVGMGAYDFYHKPIDADVLGLIIARAHQLHELQQAFARLSDLDVVSPIKGVVGASQELLQVCKTIEKVAPTDVGVLLLGESGTGKELFAQALHDMSDRGSGRFCAINCAAIPENLLESELFGYERGAFTGATKQTIGKVEYANGGTLFLDEIGDLPLPLQAKLLRFLQERTIERLGGRNEIAVDVRVVCATHQDLAKKIELSEFREDLFYRVSEVSVKIPPVRERPGDALLLATVFARKFSEQHGRVPRSFSDDAKSAIEAYSWPGNARELENKVKRAVIMAEGAIITCEDLELDADPAEHAVPLKLREVREHAEKLALRRALILSEHNVAQAAEFLGVSRPTLYDLLEKYELK